MTTEPRPTDRWIPERAGIRNVWEYDEQVFAFAGGRMILRGPNGSGKSNALALIFPFLFDGTMSASAMDPFAGGRSMKSLLLGVLRDDARSGFRHDQRLGYVWLEFTRVGSDGDEYLTIGCGARATSGGDVRSWFFTTDRRVGVDLDLAPDNTPLTRGRLIEEIGPDAVCERAEDHRLVVARDVLGVDADQLGKLNQLIRALRRPQLAGKLDLDGLSAVLSNGLPAVAPGTLEDIAASLDDLERVQNELTSVRDALATLHVFLPTYRAYLGFEARLRADVVLADDRTLESERRDLARHQKDHEELEAAGVALQGQRRAEQAAVDGASAERDAIKDSGRYQDAQELDKEEEHARSLERGATASESRRAEVVQRAEGLTERANETQEKAAGATSQAGQKLSDAADRADRIQAAWAISAEDQHEPDALRAAANVMVTERRTAVAAVRKLRRELDDATRDHRLAEEQRGRRDREADDASETVVLAQAHRDRALDALVVLVAAWLGSAPGLDDARRAELQDLVEVVSAGEPLVLGERYRLATVDHRDGLRDGRQRLNAESEERSTERGDVQAERDVVAAEEDSGPAGPAWRQADRSQRPGAPLWACCDFADAASLDESARAALEAALDAAGLLDAWISPAGARGIDDRDSDLDAWLHSEGAVTSADPGRTPRLADLLVAAVPSGSGLDAETVEGVLTTIAVGRLGIAVDIDGWFTLGPLVGRAKKASADFIGATARAERRVRRLAELDAELQLLDAELARLADRWAEVDAALRLWKSAADQAPDSMPLTTAGQDLRSREQEARQAMARAEEAAVVEQRAMALIAVASEQLATEGARQRVLTAEEELDSLDRGIAAFADAGRDAVEARRRAIELAALAAEQRRDADGATSQAAVASTEAEQAERKAVALRRRVDTLRERLGVDARAVFDELAALDQAIQDHDGRVRELGATIETNLGATGEARGRIDAGAIRIFEAESTLQESIRHLPVLRGADLLLLLGMPADDLPLDPVEFARWMAEHVGDRPDDVERGRARKAFDRSQKQLLDDLHQGYAPSLVHEDDLVLVEVTSDDHSVFGLAVLVERLEQQVADMEHHLTEGDRDIFERHLLNRVSHELRRLLGEADEFVRGVNAALADTRTASGLRVELAWAPKTDDPEVRKALGLLRRDTDQMGEDDRAALRRFFDQSIRRQRAEDPDAGYRANLEQVVDYRQWHRFQPFLIGPDGRARLTREKFRGLSGGEQAVALHLPLFAAAAAHYNRAAPTAPRLIALDEAFAGIDEAMRGELLGLTVAFDLDVLLTGHELWGAYAEVPQIAVHDLLRRPPAEGVSVFTLRWDGAELAESDLDLPAVPGAVLSDGLFAPVSEPDDGNTASSPGVET